MTCALTAADPGGKAHLRYSLAGASGWFSRRRSSGPDSTVATFFLAALLTILVSPARVPAQTTTAAGEAGPVLDAARAPASQPAASRGPARQVDPRVLYWSRALFLSLVLFVIFIFSAMAIIVFSRRFRSYLSRGRRTPTPSEDVWAMHQPPPDPPDDGAS